MLRLKSFEEISGFDAGWLKAKHHFAIGPYGNPAHKAVGNLIVLNDDEIAPHAGFGLHHHENVEIVSYLREGTVTHRDDQGNIGKTHVGDGQVMSAGTAIRHSEETFRFDYSRSGLNRLQQVEFLNGGTSRSQRPIAPAPSCPSLAAATRKVHCLFAPTPKYTGPCFRPALGRASPSAKEMRAI